MHKLQHATRTRTRLHGHNSGKKILYTTINQTTNMRISSTSVGAERFLQRGSRLRQYLRVLVTKDYHRSTCEALPVRRWASATSRITLGGDFQGSVTTVPGMFCLSSSVRNSTPAVIGVDRRRFLSTPPPPEEADFSKLRRLEDANPERVHGIRVNPDSIASGVLPGNLVYKFYKWTGNTRKVPLELAHGYFWMLNDLKATGGKPTLPNESLISEDEAQTFPMLTGLSSLSKETTDLPYYFIANKDVKCTLVNISFRDSGYQKIASWTEPFVKAFEGDKAVNCVKVSITERRSLYLLRNTLANLMRKNTHPKEHDSTLLYFGSDIDDFRDILRMHNLMTNYVFLVDGLGRVRFASSGEASPLELERVIRFAEDLSSSDTDRRGKKRSSKQRK